MKKNHTLSVTQPARTTFEFTDDEVRDALAQYLGGNGISIPAGNVFVWVRGGPYADTKWCLATLVVDHRE